MISSQLMIAFDGRELPADVARWIGQRPVAGVTLFRHRNVESAAQVRALTDALQAAAPPAHRPLLIAADQEGGQLIGLGDFTTPFAGAMAVGAATDEGLAERVARAIGRELRALGVNVNYAPVCDLATNPGNPSLGIRSFGSDPADAGRLAAATVRGLQAEGVAATAKHFPGAGDAAVDTHHTLAVVARSRAEMAERELVPFRAALDAGARLVMSGHFALPELTGDDSLPATLSRAVVSDLLRDELGFTGLAITDALDMKAVAQGPSHIIELLTALRAGMDLLLTVADPVAAAPLEVGLEQAVVRGLIDRSAVDMSASRIAELRRWLSGFADPGLDVVGCAEHLALAAELARRSMTLVRNDDGLLPLRPPAEARIAVVMPRPTDLTPADTSSLVAPALGDAIRRRHRSTDDFDIPSSPGRAEISALRDRLAGYDMLVVGTISAHLQPAQAELANALLELARPTVTIALRTPWDLTAYPASKTHVCSFGILEPTIEALCGAIFGEAPFEGHLPVGLAELYPRGHGLAL